MSRGVRVRKLNNNKLKVGRAARHTSRHVTPAAMAMAASGDRGMGDALVAAVVSRDTAAVARLLAAGAPVDWKTKVGTCEKLRRTRALPQAGGLEEPPCPVWESLVYNRGLAGHGLGCWLLPGHHSGPRFERRAVAVQRSHCGSTRPSLGTVTLQSGNSALNAAASCGCAAAVRVLLDHGADVQTTIQVRWLACAQGLANELQRGAWMQPGPGW